MSVLDSIIQGVREDLAACRKPLAQLQEAIDAAAPVRDPLETLLQNELSVDRKSVV